MTTSDPNPAEAPPRPLAGIRVLVTRPVEVAGELCALLHAAGAETIVEPMIAIEPIAFESERLEGAAWIAVTSAAGASRLSGRAPASARIAAVGPATAAALTRGGRDADFVARGGSGAALAEELPAAPGDRVILLRSDRADAELPRRLKARGIAVEEIATYRTIPRVEPAPAAATALAAGAIDAVLVASPSAVQGLANTCGRDLGRASLISIGSTTTRAARAAGLPVAAEAAHPSARGLVAALIDCTGRAVSRPQYEQSTD